MTCKVQKIKTDYYLPDKDEVHKFEVDQTIIGHEEFLKYVAKYRKYRIKTDISDTSLCDWYPYVNSYYPYTEDVDAFARVSHLLGSKPSFTSISCEEDQNPYVYVPDKMPYSEHATQMQYMKSNPFCFVILGKPDIGERELGQRLADYWQCVFIDPETLIEQEVFSGTRAGQCIEFNLRSGRAIGIDVVLRLVEKRTKSESAKHRGFIICGLPLIPNDLYKEDPISSESAVFTAKEIFEEMFDITQRLLPMPPTKPPASVASKYKAEEEEMEEEEEKEAFGEEEEEPTPKKEVSPRYPPIEIPLDMGPDFDVCQVPQIGTNYEDQLNFIFNLLKHPYMIIYIMCSSADVIEKRRSYRFDVRSKQNINLQTEVYNNMIFTLHAQQENLNEELLNDFLETSYLDIDTSRLDYLVRLPRHFPANISTQLDSYHYTGLHFIERRVLMHDPQYFIKVDGRVNVKRMFRIVKARLNILPIQQVILPSRLIVEPLDLGEGGGGGGDEAAEPIDVETIYGELSRSQVPSNIFKWHWSDWGMKCPVALREGVVTEGDPKYAVHFMNKIFFLASEENFLKFYRNPRPYLLPPNPKPVCRIFVFGPKLSGKTAVSRCLAYLLDGNVLKASDMMEMYISNQEEELKEAVRHAAIAEALRLLALQKEEEANMLEAERIEKIKEWIADTKRTIEDLIAVMIEMAEEKKNTSFEISSFPMAMKTVSIMEVENPLQLEYTRLKEYLQSLHIPILQKIEDWQALLADKRKLLVYLPGPLRNRVTPRPAEESDSFVQDFAQNAVDHADLEDAPKNNKNLVDIISHRIKDVEDQQEEQENAKKGWVLDGMLCEQAIVEELYPDFMPDEIITLLDEEGSDFLAARYECDGDDTDFTEFREFFLKIGKDDAAWRAPAYIPKKPCATRIAKEILHDLINDPTYFDYEDNGPVSKVEVYRQEVETFNKKWEELKQFFLDHNITPTEVKVTDRSMPDLLAEIVERVLDKYRIAASLFTELDRAEEVKNFGNQMLQKDAGEGPADADEDAFERNRRYGDTHYYCPVTFHEKRVLWKGKEDFAVKHEDKLYLLSSENDMNKFLQEPRLYLPGEPPEVFPPPRICVIGIPGTGRTTVAKALATNYGLVYVSFESLLKKSFFVSSPQSLDELRRNQNIDANLDAYLNLDVPLAEELLYNILSKLWFDQPTVGFVLDDFPKRPSDVKVMTDFKLIPDIVINLTNDIGQIKDIIITEYLRRWEIEVNKKREEAENANRLLRIDWEEKRKVRFEELIEERREQRYATKIKRRESGEQPPTDRPYMEDLREEDENEEDEEGEGFKSESQVSFDSVAEQDDVNEVNRLLDQELPEPVMEEVSETVDEATDKYDTLAMDTINVESSFLVNVQGLCSADEIPVADTIVHPNNPDLTIRQAFYISDKIKFRTQSHFERCYDVSMEVAERLLSSGYFFLSKFGKTCPVQYYEDKIPVQMYSPMEARNNLFPVLHRTYIYYLTGRENQVKFKEDPLKYLYVETFNFPLITFRVAVTGPPKCGKTVLSSRIASEFGFKLITRGEAARYVLAFLPLSDLAKNMETVLRQGWELTDEMVVKCVEAATFDSKAVTQGIVLDGFPNTITEARHLSYVGLVPNLDMELEANRHEVYECLSNDVGRRGMPRYSQWFIEHLLSEWNMYSPPFKEWFDREYQVMTKIRIRTSNWSVWYQTNKYITAVFFEIKHYFVHIVEDWPLRLANMQITPLEFLERQGAFRSYCPCCLHYTNLLTSGGEPPDRTGLVQYRYFFYWICADHIEIFLKNPDIFMVPYNNHSLPTMLPIRLYNLTSMPDNVFEEGLCVICYKDRHIYIKGKLSIAAAYNNKVYLFLTEECIRKFMCNPLKYMCEISFKPPDNYPPLNYEDLPVMGMLEQYMVKFITRSLSFVARNRPVIPGLPINTSALIGMGLSLKMFNPKIPDEFRPLYKEAEGLYHERRKKLINYLDRMKSVINPFLYYENPMPDFEVPDSIQSETTESITTTVTKIVDEIVDNIDYDT